MALVGVLVLAGMLILPGLPHLTGHENDTDSDGSCDLCVLLNLVFLAVPVLLKAISGG